jgi:hypothetical protein
MSRAWIRFPVTIRVVGASIAAPIWGALILSLLVACGDSNDDETINPPATHKTVFLSSASYDGNLGGLSAADAKCQSLANAARLGGTYRAWISDSIVGVESRMTKSDLPYLLVNGTKIADGFDDLADDSIDHAFNVDEKGVPHGNPEVWTGWREYSCGNWTTNSSGSQGLVGVAGETGHAWQAAYYQFCNRTNVRLYCIEQ